LYRFVADRLKEKSAAAAVHLPSLEVQGLPEDISECTLLLFTHVTLRCSICCHCVSVCLFVYHSLELYQND